MIAILLAGGAGRKFWPYAEVRNKCAFPIGNMPLVRRLAKQLLREGVEGLVVVLGQHPGYVRAALQGLEDRITWVAQPQPAGTADATLRALDHLGTGAGGAFLVAHADVILAEEVVRAVVQAARRPDAPAVALVQPLNDERVSDWITAQVKDGALAEFQGHSRRAYSHRLCGLYALSDAAIPYLRANPGVMTHVPVGGMPPAEAEIAESLARMADDGLAVRALECSGFFVDVDKPWHILEATQALLADMASRLDGDHIADGAQVADGAEVHGRLVLEPGATIGERVVVKGDLWLGPGASVTNGSIIGPRCMLGRNAIVRDYALLDGDTVLGPEAICGHGAEFSGVALERSYLYHYCEIYGVIGACVDIGAATVCGTLRFDDGDTVHRVQGRPERPRVGANASYLGDYSRTGVNAVLMPGVKVGAYSCVGAGVVLYEDLPSRELVLVKQELVRRPWGPERYGW